MERKLASIQRIEGIEPILDADNILKARVMGWDVVIKKGEFEPGSLCVFFEIDSLLPEGRPWAEFMRPRGFRVKTVRLRGVLSQGLALPLSIMGDRANDPTISVGLEVTRELGIAKYEPPLPESLEVAGPFPGRIPKTDEIRLQSALGVLEEIRGSELYITTKCDGTSATFFKDLEENGQLSVCTRNWTLAKGNNQAWRLAEKLGLEAKLPPGFAVQGEICGPGIQKNRLSLAEESLFVFSVYDALSGKYLDHDAFRSFTEELGLRTVRVEGIVKGDDAKSFDHTLEHYLALAKGLYPGTRNRKEGIVVRPLVEAYSPTLQGRLSFKVINNEFLLKDED